MDFINAISIVVLAMAFLFSLFDLMKPSEFTKKGQKKSFNWFFTKVEYGREAEVFRKISELFFVIVFIVIVLLYFSLLK